MILFSRRIPNRRGIGFPWAIITLSVVMAFTSMIFDYGRVQLVKMQLQRTADAAARAAVSQISTSITATQNEAVAIGSANSADAYPVTIDPNNDVVFGTWNTSSRTFTTLTGAARSNANAIQITCQRTAARGTAVPLYFTALLGRTSCDVTATATAYITPASSSSGPGFVGLSSFNSSSINTDSYNATLGSYGSQTPGTSGNVISNSDLYLWSSNISGNAYPGSGHTQYGGSISGSVTPLTSTISYTGDTFPTSNNNNKINSQINSGTGSFDGSNLSTWGSITLPGGTYVLSNAGIYAPLIFTGPAKIYIVGSFSVAGGGYITTYQNNPANLLIECKGSLGLYPAQPIYADMFSPQASLSMSPGSASDFYGQIIVSSWAVYSYNLHFDTSLPSHNPSGGGISGSGSGSGGSSGTISLVQ